MSSNQAAVVADEAARPGRCRITVESDRAASFDVGRNELLLLSAIAQGVEYPHNCRVGTCGRCKTRLISGRISPMVDFALSPLSNQELKDGYILACQAKVRGDLVIDVKLGGTSVLPVRTVSSRVVRWERLPGEVIDLRLKLDEPLRFNAGQYCTIAESGSFVRRSYSFYDAPPAADSEGAQEVGFLVKRLPGGQFSEWLFERDRVGTKVWLEGPFGMMGVADHDRDGLCVAGGTGLAPILSIVADRLQRSTGARFTIVFGLRTSRDVFANEALQQLLARYPERLRLVTILSHEPAGSSWQGPRGLITAALDAQLGVDYRDVTAFVCGSLPMVEAVEKTLQRLGLPPERIHADKFLPTGY
ncbi:2Fe-2S iron-sulfur cluster-binding protein [Hydrocarboniphaga sp.]|uniref:2Fe-2S iron-sulfur cluster-binding protein n=1 Tax=Hydrocarboniphaga sp. TaxID=2033016 RepID=UPI003D12A5E5